MQTGVREIIYPLQPTSRCEILRCDAIQPGTQIVMTGAEMCYHSLVEAMTVVCNKA